MNVRFLIKRFLNMDLKKRKEKINKIKELSNKSKLEISLDLLWCGLRYQAGYMDYLTFKFWDLTNQQRKRYVTTGINNKYTKYLNDKDKWAIFEKKNLFNKKFKRYIKRDYLFVDEHSSIEILNFIKDKNVFIAKPYNGMCGVGVTKINKKDFQNDVDVLKYLVENKLNILEEYIIQHPKMHKLHPHSVNTVRIITILKDNNIHVVASFLRIGNGDVVDNFNSGGLTCPIDVKTGKVIDVAVDKNGSFYTKHPLTNEDIVDFEIPHWDKVLKLLDRVCHLVPSIRYVGWDIAIGVDEPILVEGNQYPSNDIYQMPIHLRDGYGYLPIFREIEKI